jgi:phosphonate transport system substrate-binding protein
MLPLPLSHIGKPRTEALRRALREITVAASAADLLFLEDWENLTRMISKGMVKDASGKPLTKDDFRVILKSDLIINSSTAMLESLPADMKATIRKAFLDAAKNDKAAFDKLSDGKNRPWEPIDTAAYNDTIKLIQFVDALRKKSV